MDFMSLALQCSFLPVSLGLCAEPLIESPGFLIQPGVGEPSRSGDRLTVDFWIRDESGKEIANSERRGFCHTFDLFGQPGDGLLNGAALGAREGEERVLVMLAEEWHGELGFFRLIRNPGPLLVRIRVARIERR